MELIQKEIPQEHETNERMWIYKENKDLFNKFSQIEIKPIDSITIKKKEEVKVEVKMEAETKVKTRKETPLELIIKYTSTPNDMKKEIKDKIVEFVSIPEFSKAFGVKKSAEVITALSRDSWNQSMALFISFLLDSNIIYKEKSYLFNKEKNNKDIVIVN